MLPFTAEAFFSHFESYNRAVWPAQIVAYLLGAAALVLAFRPVAGSSRAIAAILAAAWLWMGIVYHWMHFATINVAAPAFAVFFVVEGLLFAWSAARGRIAFRFRPDLFGWTGLGLALFAMVLYPLLGWLAGHGWPRAPMLGVAPCPTTIFTIGLLLMVERRTPLHLAAIPVLWSLVGGTASWLLDVPEDIALPIAGIGGLALVLWKNRRARASACRQARQL